MARLNRIRCPVSALVLLCIAVLSMTSGKAACPAVVRLTNGKWPPYSCKEMEGNGIFTRVVTEELES